MDVLEPKYYAAIGMVMTLIAVIFLFLMGSALVHSTKSFWQGYSTELSLSLIHISEPTRP